VPSETSKSAKRRQSDPLFRDKVFVGDGIDIGSGNDGFSTHAYRFPRVASVRDWDMPDGDAQEMPGVEPCTYDFLHSSHSLEHMRDADQALARWIEIVKPGGYLAVTVPDWVLYEKCMWPSRFNPDHKASFTTTHPDAVMPHVKNVHRMCWRLRKAAKTVRVKLLVDGYPDGLPTFADATALPGVEAAIEFVLQKRSP
jgi:predicted SAM-dependent methyltransferase